MFFNIQSNISYNKKIINIILKFLLFLENDVLKVFKKHHTKTKIKVTFQKPRRENKRDEIPKGLEKKTNNPPHNSQKQTLETINQQRFREGKRMGRRITTGSTTGSGLGSQGIEKKLEQQQIIGTDCGGSSLTGSPVCVCVSQQCDFLADTLLQFETNVFSPLEILKHLNPSILIFGSRCKMLWSLKIRYDKKSFLYPGMIPFSAVNRIKLGGMWCAFCVTIPKAHCTGGSYYLVIQTGKGYYERRKVLNREGYIKEEEWRGCVEQGWYCITMCYSVGGVEGGDSRGKRGEEGGMAGEAQTPKSWVEDSLISLCMECLVEACGVKQYMQRHAGLHRLYCIMHGMFGWQHVDSTAIYASGCRVCTALVQLCMEESRLWLRQYGKRSPEAVQIPTFTDTDSEEPVLVYQVGGSGLSGNNFVYKGLLTFTSDLRASTTY
ncbi:hypothetical protein VP01_2854g4 [Puccinia sorghi]|uniref:Uncharacterized protein n=1 Tax=Puccinia sorghi TaxID=27349 RepID=A0A0L6V2S6_9BASI|nr:hypothetical protein VP01_2854g4 [Puccinia sorghi]